MSQDSREKWCEEPDAGGGGGGRGGGWRRREKRERIC